MTNNVSIYCPNTGSDFQRTLAHHDFGTHLAAEYSVLGPVQGHVIKLSQYWNI